MAASASRELARLAVQIRACTRCTLHRSRTHAVPGEGPARARILLVGEAPGRREDVEGRPFIGAAGRLLDDALRRAEIRRQTTFITNAVKCRPPGNRRPRPPELAACRPYLIAQLAAIRPRVVVALGLTAAKDLLGRPMSLSTARRSRHSLAGTPVIATYHPAAVLRNRRLLPKLVGDLRKARRRAEGS